MKELLEMIAKALVDNPDRFRVRAVEGGLYWLAFNAGSDDRTSR